MRVGRLDSQTAGEEDGGDGDLMPEWHLQTPHERDGDGENDKVN